ncbi:hypothetical protein ACFO5R_17920 [Halosolutus amylolyticus]|uniref:Uncharacterized protein n=1 Tax=Halosolutus amylolyticus TaxID=2932267 RepID=A0ABD5PTB8_9EURY|nr:hypothetical protein [Halosolutus amylolyticus]
MSPLDVTVHVNRGSADAVLETDVDTVETCEPIQLVLRGHETPAHVHCRLDERLDRVASIDGSNYYVEPDDVTPVPIRVDAEAIESPVEGTLEIVGGYGAESVSIDVTVTPGPPQVDVDDSLAEPTRSEPEPTPIERAVTGFSALTGIEMGTIAVVALGLVAIGIATATAATIGGPVAIGGLAIVVVGVAVGLGLLIR